MQTGFEYNYKNNTEIIEHILSIADFWVFEFWLLLGLILFVFIGVYFLFPLLFIIKKYFERQKQNIKRKLMLQQIATQRDIEDEIEAEIEETAKAQAQAMK